MDIYDIFMNPFERLLLADIRKRCIPMARGRVLEIGIGTGANLPYYNLNKINILIGLDIKLSNKVTKKIKCKTKLIQGSAESLPFSDSSFDTVVISLVLCSVENPDKSIAEIKRVLKPNGKLIFIEHILPTEQKLASIFNRMNRAWSCLAHGCNLNRKTDMVFARNFQVENINKAGKGIFCYGTANNYYEEMC